MTIKKFMGKCLMVMYGSMFFRVNSEGHSLAWRFIGSILVILLAIITVWFAEREVD